MFVVFLKSLIASYIGSTSSFLKIQLVLQVYMENSSAYPTIFNIKPSNFGKMRMEYSDMSSTYSPMSTMDILGTYILNFGAV